jgi:hypothetical protein
MLVLARKMGKILRGPFLIFVANIAANVFPNVLIINVLRDIRRLKPPLHYATNPPIRQYFSYNFPYTEAVVLSGKYSASKPEDIATCAASSVG